MRQTPREPPTASEGPLWRRRQPTVRVEPIRVFEPICEAGRQSPEQLARTSSYTEGLARWRARDFAGAAQAFAVSADADAPSALYLERAKLLAENPPAENWRPVQTLEEK